MMSHFLLLSKHCQNLEMPLKPDGIFLLCNLQDDTNMTVVICPDYVVYRDDLCSVCHITFSCTGIKIKNSTASENQGRYSWGIDDIVDIECQWFQKVRLCIQVSLGLCICFSLKIYGFLCGHHVGCVSCG